jgi:hypothetical protein
MRSRLLRLASAALLLASWSLPPRALASNLDEIADRVIGQTGFASGDYGLGPSSLDEPEAVALDAHGNLYVADQSNNRVLEYSAPLTNGMSANLVFGQPNPFTNTLSSPSDHSLAGPIGLAVDAVGDLYVADTANDRVLEL